MKKTYLLLLLIFLGPEILLAQKNAPVAGDAAMLVDLLKKNYNAIDPAAVNDELIKDRSQVIATFKSYMTNDQLKALTIAMTEKNVSNKSVEKSNIKQREYKKAQQDLSSFNSITINSKDGVDAINVSNRLVELSGKVETAKQNFYDFKHRADNEELELLRDNYRNINNYAEYIIDQFINKYKAINENAGDTFAKSNPNASLQKGLPFLGGDFGFEVVIEGLSKFLAKRIKEELTTEVIDKIKEWLKNPGEDDPLAELKVLLPRTNNYLLNFNASQVTSFPNEIKQYIEDDFNHILENMAELRNTPRIHRLIANHPEVDFAMEAMELIPTLSKIKNPIDYFETIENSRNLNRWSSSDEPVKCNIANSLRLSSMLAHSLTIIEDGQPRFLSSDFVNNYGSDLNFYLLYVGFLYQQNSKYYDIHFISKTDIAINVITINNYADTSRLEQPVKQFDLPLSISMNTLISSFNKDKIDDLKKDREFFETLFIQIAKNSEKVYSSSLEIKKANKKGDKIGADTVYTFVKSIIDLAEEVTFSSDTLVNYFISKTGIIDKNIGEITINYSTSKLIISGVSEKKVNIPYLRLKEKAEPYFTVANKTNDIILDLQTKKYAIAILKALELTSDVVPNKSKQLLTTLSKSPTILPEIKTKSINKRLVIDGCFTEEWNKVIPIIYKAEVNSEFKIDKKLVAASTIIYGELVKINNYYHSHYEVDQKTLTNMIKLMSLVNEMKVSEKIKFDKNTTLLDVKNVLNNPDFHQIIVSYYSMIRVDEFAEELEKEMNELTVDINGVSVNVFKPEEASELKACFLTYTDEVFKFLVWNEKVTFETAQKTFIHTVDSLFLRAPERPNLHINENVLKLVHFINDMALSQSSEDIEKAIEAIALPSGSYNIKRESISNISINSFPGILPAYELTWKNKKSYGSFSPSFTVPIGLCFSTSNLKGASHGIFVPIIDIGAITRMHLGNEISTDSTSLSTLPQFSFLSIFSPGLYYHIGFRKTPCSLNIGMQYGPGLKEIQKDGNHKIYESIRIGFNFALDIPLLNVHTKPRFKE